MTSMLCQADVWRNWHFYPCGAPGTILEQSKRWCGRHAPSAVERRAATTKAKHDAKMDAWRRQEDRKAAQVEVVEAAKALDQTYVKWADLGLAGIRMQDALTKLAKTELDPIHGPPAYETGAKMRIRYPWHGGGDRPMIWAEGEVIEVKNDWLAIIDPDGRKIWRWSKDPNVIVL